MLARLTPEGRRTVVERPERITQVNAEVEDMGARVIQQWAVLGPYDFVSIVEASDNETIAEISFKLGSRGTVEFLTMPAITLPDH
ncbi:GYD domain-containing protein [soil metagenome]